MLPCLKQAISRQQVLQKHFQQEKSRKKKITLIKGLYYEFETLSN
jgi:hypothetical protein